MYSSLCPCAIRLFTDTSYSRTHSLIKMESMCLMLAVKRRRRTGSPLFARSPPGFVTSTLRSMDTLQSKSHPFMGCIHIHVVSARIAICVCACAVCEGVQWSRVASPLLTVLCDSGSVQLCGHVWLCVCESY